MTPPTMGYGIRPTENLPRAVCRLKNSSNVLIQNFEQKPLSSWKENNHWEINS